LIEDEFRAVNSPTRRLLQRHVEFPLFRWLGLKQHGLDILEVGCGSGYGAVLLSQIEPRSYVGIDLMPEMIELARKQPGLDGYEFLVMDAASMNSIADESKDVVVIFDILHHIPEWREVIRECHRVLRPGGAMFLEEPWSSAVKLADAIVHWGHPNDAQFSRRELEEQFRAVGFTITKKLLLWPFKFYCVEKT
jgi:ubiquinone/menaquinone biosynthesis C-methylase UbiE